MAVKVFKPTERIACVEVLVRDLSGGYSMRIAHNLSVPNDVVTGLVCWRSQPTKSWSTNLLGLPGRYRPLSLPARMMRSTRPPGRAGCSMSSPVNAAGTAHSIMF